MIFLVILIALLIERFFDWSHLRHWHWLTQLQSVISRRMPNASPAFILGLTIVPILFVTLVLEMALDNLLFGVVEFVFQIVLLLYCLGPQNLWADTYACINALVQGDSRLADDKLKAAFGITQPDQLLNQVFIAANRRVFATVFWFMIFGPVGAVLYRTVTLAASELTRVARFIETVLDWIPVRFLACLFALGGHFVQVFSCWQKETALSLDANETLLTHCGAAALSENKTETPAAMGATVRSAVGLLDRSFVILLVLIALYAFLN